MIPPPLPIIPSMEMSPFFLILPLLLVILLHCIKRKKTKSSSSASTSKSFLPPGTMGWPFIGETFQLYSSNTNNFFEEKQRRYGPVFKTHILGCPCIMVSSPEAAKFVLLTKANLFKPTFPASKERILGSQAIFFQEGEYHSRLRRLVLRAFMPESIRRKIAGIEEIAVRMLSSCDGRLICCYQEMKTYALNVSLLSIFGKEERSSIEELKQCYYILEKGYNSMPLNIPGTLFHKALRARKQLGLLVERIISSRRKSEGTDQFVTGDLLASFMETKEALSDDQIAHNIIGVIFAARDTTASVLTWILKYLAENPAILQAVTVDADEQEEIRRSKEMIGGDKEERGLNWDDTKRMPITCRVIQETLRIASILSFTFREAAQDVEYEGYLIPKGWKVLPLFRNIHHSPDNFPEPDKFDPSRFEVTPKPNTYMPFGNGIHACPGNELAKLEILVFLHHLTINYRWSISGSNSGFQFGPFALPLDGLPITIHRLQQENKLISSN